jgi:hypothetical protein
LCPRFLTLGKPNLNSKSAFFLEGTSKVQRR